MNFKQFVPSNKSMNIGLDIDNTITSYPSFFRSLSEDVQRLQGQVFIVSSRTKLADVEVATIKELRDIGIHFNELYLLPSFEEAELSCSHNDLDWYQKYLWQKVDFCIRRKITAFFDDDSKVISLFRRYASTIESYHVE